MSRIAGIDEVGRGALAGPVVVAAVCFEESEQKKLIRQILKEAGVAKLKDSKQLTKSQRERLFEAARFLVCWSVGWAEAEDIDRDGLVPSLTAAAGRAVDMLRQLSAPSDLIHADAGLYHPYEDTYPTKRFVKGDEQFSEIALASVMAKVWRDRHMAEYDALYPGYGFASNVGYGSKAHLSAIDALGASKIHRRSFLTKRPRV